MSWTVGVCAPPAIPLGAPGHVERQQLRSVAFARLTAERAELFARLRCPQSIKGIKKPGVLS